MRTTFLAIFVSALLYSAQIEAQVRSNVDRTNYKRNQVASSSAIGIDYLTLANFDTTLAEILSGGEAEWLSNFKNRRAEKMWVLLIHDLMDHATDTDISGNKSTRLINYAPNMVDNFERLSKPQYPLFHQILRQKKSSDLASKLGTTQDDTRRK